MRHKKRRIHHRRKRKVIVTRRRAVKRVVRHRRKKIHVRKRRASRRRHVRNPFLSELMLIGNPRKHHRRKSMAKRRHHRRRHSYLANPVSLKGITSTAKGIVSKENTMAAVGVAAGFVVTNLVMAKIPATWKSSHLKAYASKIACITAVTIASGFVSKRVQKFVLLGGTASIILDIYTDFVAPMISGIGAPAATSMYMGRKGTGMYMGRNGRGSSLSANMADMPSDGISL